MSEIRVGDTVRIRETYPEYIHTYEGFPAQKNQPGVEFVVTERVDSEGLHRNNRFDLMDTHYVKGDPNGWGIWESQVEKVSE